MKRRSVRIFTLIVALAMMGTMLAIPASAAAPKTNFNFNIGLDGNGNISLGTLGGITIENIERTSEAGSQWQNIRITLGANTTGSLDTLLETIRTTIGVDYTYGIEHDGNKTVLNLRYLNSGTTNLKDLWNIISGNTGNSGNSGDSGSSSGNTGGNSGNNQGTKGDPLSKMTNENGRYYYYRNGSKVKDEMLEIDGYTFYFDQRGEMVTGWHGDYFFNTLRDIDQPYGSMMTGWVEISAYSGTYKYFFSRENTEHYRKGQLYRNGRFCIDGVYYNIDSAGVVRQY